MQDIHPPGYFLWLNSVIRAGFGVSPHLGLISNIPFFVLNSVLLFYLGLRLFGRSREALLGLAIWGLASSTIETTLVARHYEILTSFTLASTLVAVDSLQRAQLGLSAVVGLAYSA